MCIRTVFAWFSCFISLEVVALCSNLFFYCFFVFLLLLFIVCYDILYSYSCFNLSLGVWHLGYGPLA